MLGLPERTEFNKRIPKQKFYENMEVSPALKRVFVEQIRIIYWRNKLAATTMNIAAGEEVTEIEVFEVRVQEPQFDEAVLRQIDKEIPYHILFLLTCDRKEQAWIGYKEAAASGSNAFKVSRYYHTDWVPEGNLQLLHRRSEIRMLSMLTLCGRIAGDSLSSTQGETLQESVARDEAKQELLKKIASLEMKIRKEKQLNRKMELNAELKKIRKKMESLLGGR